MIKVNPWISVHNISYHSYYPGDCLAAPDLEYIDQGGHELLRVYCYWGAAHTCYYRYTWPGRAPQMGVSM